MYVSGRKVRKVNFLRNKWPEMEMSKVKRKKYSRITLIFIFGFIKFWKIKCMTTDFSLFLENWIPSCLFIQSWSLTPFLFLYFIISCQFDFVFILWNFIYKNWSFQGVRGINRKRKNTIKNTCSFLPYYVWYIGHI